MKRYSLPLVLLTSLLLLSFSELTDKVSLAFKAGNATEIIKYCKSSIDLTILDDNDLYSKSEAKGKLVAFFSSYPPKDFRVIHQGKSKTGLEYTIGTLITEKENFRVSFYVKTENDRALIQQLMIDAVE